MNTISTASMTESYFVGCTVSLNDVLPISIANSDWTGGSAAYSDLEEGECDSYHWLWVQY